MAPREELLGVLRQRYGRAAPAERRSRLDLLDINLGAADGVLHLLLTLSTRLPRDTSPTTWASLLTSTSSVVPHQIDPSLLDG
jgi:hypothetical protein